jgi:putative hydrolase of the HAD superfamily
MQIYDRPKVIFFDAVGTLFGVKGSVGTAYAAIAADYGVIAAPQTLDWAFITAFKQAGTPAFPNTLPEDIPAKEYAWWRQVAIATFDQAGVLPLFDDFDEFFSTLFTHFATAAPWEVYPETYSTLEQLRSAAIPLGILSNFDSRIYSVLRSLDLASFFQSITISTEAGAAKPAPQIFQTALQKHRCQPAEAWHVGDSLSEDYRAATAIGMRGLWIDRANSK